MYPFGQYTFEMYVFDTSGNNATIRDIVTVGDDIAPVVSPGPDVYIIYSFTNNGIANWTVYEAFPSTYSLFLNGTILESGSFTGDTFIYNASILEAGNWELKLFISDTSGNTGYGSVYVHVSYIETDPPVIVTLPEDTIHHIDEGPVPLEWVVYDAYPENYSIYQDGILVLSGQIQVDAAVSGKNYIIQFVFSPSSVSDYAFHIVIVDQWGFTTSSNETTIYVLAPQSELSPEIRPVNDLVIAISQDQYEIQWIINENNPQSYQISIDGIADATRSWDGSIIKVNLDLNELGLGVHTISITVANSNGYSSTYTINVLIIEGKSSGSSGSFLPFTPLWILLMSFAMITIIKRRMRL